MPSNDLLQQNSISRWPSQVAVVMLGSASSLFFYLLPIIVGSLAVHLRLNSLQLGIVASADEVGYTLASISAFFWVRRVNWRIAGAVGVSLILIGNALCIAAIEVYPVLLVGRLLAGIGAACLQSIVLSSVSDLQHPERLFGFVLATQVICGSLSLLVVPDLQRIMGETAVFFTPIALILVAAPALYCLPRRPTLAATHDALMKPIDKSRGPIYCLIGFALFHVAVFATWTYCERIAHMAGIASSRISTILGLTTLAGLAGAIAASGLGDRWGRIGPLSVAVAAYCLVSFRMGYTMSEPAFIFAMIVFQFFCLHFSLPYLWGSVGQSDGSGRFIVLTGLAAGLGGVTGANLGSYLIALGDLNWWRLVCCMCCILSLIAIIKGSRDFRRVDALEHK